MVEKIHTTRKGPGIFAVIENLSVDDAMDCLGLRISNFMNDNGMIIKEIRGAHDTRKYEILEILDMPDYRYELVDSNGEINVKCHMTSKPKTNYVGTINMRYVSDKSRLQKISSYEDAPHHVGKILSAGIYAYFPNEELKNEFIKASCP